MYLNNKKKKQFDLFVYPVQYIINIIADFVTGKLSMHIMHTLFIYSRAKGERNKILAKMHFSQ